MDTTAYRELIVRILSDHARVPYMDSNVRHLTVFDRTGDHYLLLHEGWQGVRREHGCVVHVDLIDGKFWIQKDGTEDGIATELMAAGVPKEHIVLAFRSPDARKHTEFAVA